MAGLSFFPQALGALAEDLIALRNAAVFIRDSSGDLTFQALNQMHDAYRALRFAYDRAYAEAVKQPAAAASFLSSMGGPASLATLNTQLTAIGTAMTAWNGVLETALGTISATDLVYLTTINQSNVSTKHPTFKIAVPASVADPLRLVSELDDLITAIEATGAA